MIIHSFELMLKNLRAPVTKHELVTWTLITDLQKKHD